ncbi:hypothetical protein [Emticicia sp. BO119]|uniref:hypothetical protein n=1 Tax=Emticicia sp. BO119 TaxID=2757768 RepID=UPI0015F05591|nr:hypothetical protein [Emticicia sp. BO119]MBA4853334.1 hypothetical protein [Emticicia sp. BO119]
MKRIFVCLFSFITLGSFAQDTPTADAIIDKYITAIGGKEAISKIQDITINSTTESQRGTSETEIKYKFPDKYAMSMYFNGNPGMTTVYDGKNFKSSGGFGGRGGGNGGGGNRPQLEGNAAKIQAMRSNPFFETMYKDLGITGSVAGTEKVGDKDAYKVEFSTADGRKWTDFFDTASGLKLKNFTSNETPRGKFEQTTIFENYKKFKGTDVLIPAVSKRSGGQMGEIVSEIQSIKVNKGLKDSEFEIKE